MQKAEVADETSEYYHQGTKTRRGGRGRPLGGLGVPFGSPRRRSVIPSLSRNLALRRGPCGFATVGTSRAGLGGSIPFRGLKHEQG